MRFNRVNLLRCLIVAVAATVGCDAMAAQAPNPRGASMTATNARGADSVNVSRAATNRAVSRAVDGRASARGAVVSNAMRGGATVGRTATTLRSTNVRNATSASAARSAARPAASRASVARATAVFNDVSKIGGGYANCREAYATCMDQFCANANDTYRRCYCSSRYAEFRNTEDALDEAKTLLMQFEDNNLNAVDKTAAEVNAMYSATVGEAAIKRDTSGAAKVLDEIGDLLSGKKKTSTFNTSTTSLGVLSIDITGDIDDIWSDGGNSIFSGNGGQNLSDLDGVSLYNAANKQCLAMVSDSCESTPVLNMARSSYSIMITQDCNAYQKSIDKKVEGVKQTVRQAEKYLREARLDEYRSHNSADVNECITKVRAALTADTACGANYKRCLDYTGAYINQTTGEPIYTPRLFQLTDIITLDGNGSDVLRQNPNFDKFLETRKMFATSALDTCRDIQKLVWEEFKRTALIEIAQAQDDKIEEVKMSCVSTMAECYDTQSSALRDFDTTTAQMSGALSAYAAKQMCMEKVSACAALYGNGETCQFGNDGKLQNSTACGLTALTKFVDSVDTIRINEGCETAMENYARELCTPTSGTMGYPWNCRLMDIGQVRSNLMNMAGTYCISSMTGADTVTVINRLVEDIQMDISDMMAQQCESADGIWYDRESVVEANPEYASAFYRNVYGTATPRKYRNGDTETEIRSYGVCLKNTLKSRCELENVGTNSDGNNNYATYDAATDRCRFTIDYYKYQCETVNGMWEENRCYLER